MGLFKAPTESAAFLKEGLFGTNGSGKSLTAALQAIGIVRRLGGKGKVAWFDTEGGFGYVQDLFERAKVQADVARTQSFKDLRDGIREAESSKYTVFVIDSITHPWRTLVAGFKAAKNIKTKALPIYAWDILKTEWREGFANPFTNSSLHIVMCGRSANVFEDIYDEKNDERKSIVVGTKMATEGETGYEPSLLVELTKELRIEDEKGRAIAKDSPGQYARRAFVVKDRFSEIDGLSTVFVMPRLKNGEPDFDRLISENQPMAFFGRHFDRLRIGKTQAVIQSGTNTEQMFDDAAGETIAKMREKRDIMVKDCAQLLVKHFPGQSSEDKRSKATIIEAAFGTRVWDVVEKMRLEDVEAAHHRIETLLETAPRDLIEGALQEGVEGGKIVDANASVAAVRRLIDVSIRDRAEKTKQAQPDDLDGLFEDAPTQTPPQVDRGELEVAAPAPANKS